MRSVILFTGLPFDVREQDLVELLSADPTRIPAHSSRVTALHDSTRAFLGTFLVEVDTDAEAERVRQQFSGQMIDGSHKLQVHHVLPPTMPHPALGSNPAPRIVIPPFSAEPAAAAPQVQHPIQRVPVQHSPIQHAPAPRAPAQSFTHGSHGARPPAPQPKRRQPNPAPVELRQQRQAPPKVEKKNTGPEKPEGLKLLGRMGKTGVAAEKEKEKLRLAKQRAALQRKSPGEALLSRLKIPKGSAPAKASAAKKTPANKAAAVKGSDKVARAKGKMEVDAKAKAKPKPAQPPQPKKEKKEKPKPKTQSELDEEMKAYERARRFGAAA